MIIKAQAGNCIINFDRVNYIRVYDNYITAVMSDEAYVDVGEYWDEETALQVLDKLAAAMSEGTSVIVAPQSVVFYAVEFLSADSVYSYCVVTGATTKREAIDSFCREYSEEPSSIVKSATADTFEEANDIVNKWRLERSEADG